MAQLGFKREASVDLMETSSRYSNEERARESFMNLKRVKKLCKRRAALAPLYFHANLRRAWQPAGIAGVGEGGAQITPSRIGCRQRLLSFIIITNIRCCRLEVALRWNKKESKRRRKKYSKNHVGWVNEERVMKGLQGIHKHWKPNIEQSGVGFN